MAHAWSNVCWYIAQTLLTSLFSDGRERQIPRLALLVTLPSDLLNIDGTLCGLYDKV